MVYKNEKNLILLSLPLIIYSCVKIDAINIKDNNLQATANVDAKANLTANTNATANINTNFQNTFIDNTSAFPVINMPNEIEIEKESIIDINFDTRIDFKNSLSLYSTNDNVLKIISFGKIQAIGQGQANLIVLYKDRTAKIMKIKVKETLNIKPSPTLTPSPTYTIVVTPYPTPIYTYNPTPYTSPTPYIIPTPIPTTTPTNYVYITPSPTITYTPFPTSTPTVMATQSSTPIPSSTPNHLNPLFSPANIDFSFVNTNSSLVSIKLNARNLSISPNGKKIVYTNKDGAMYIKDYESKDEIKLRDTGHYAMFINNNDIMYVDDKGIFKINIDGSNQEKVFDFDFGYFIRFSPDGKKILYRKDYNSTAIYLMDISTNKSVKIIDDLNIFASLEWSDDSSMIVATRGSIYQNPSEQAIHLYDNNGNLLNSFYDTGFYPRLSPDNKKIAYYNQSGLFIIDIETKKITHLAKENSGLLGLKIDWSNDGKKIYYQSYAGFGDNKYINVYDLETMTYKNLLKGFFIAEYNDTLDLIISSYPRY